MRHVTPGRDSQERTTPSTGVAELCDPPVVSLRWELPHETSKNSRRRPERAGHGRRVHAAWSSDQAAGAQAAATAATPLPAHVFAPYFEAYNGDSPAALSQASGAKYLTMAFVQTEAQGSCTPYWNGDSSTPIAQSEYGADFTTIRSRGGDVIPSFGGYAADNGGTEIADSCTSVDSIAAAYEKVITTYDVSRLDMDIEDNSLENSAGIDRRNKAIKKVQDWAAANGRSVQISYTLPTTTSGLASSGLAVLKNAVTNGAQVDVVNLMTFDYYDGASHNMAQDTQTAITGLKGQLAKLYPSKSEAQLWGMTGIIEMPGIDDYGPAETFTTADATSVYNWAVSKGVSTLSFWALQRDNGGCPGTGGSDTCSGIAQDTWYFSHTFAPFTTGGGTGPVTDDYSVAVAPGSATVAPGGSATATVSTAVTSGSAKTVALTTSGAAGRCDGHAQPDVGHRGRYLCAEGHRLRVGRARHVQGQRDRRGGHAEPHGGLHADGLRSRGRHRIAGERRLRDGFARPLDL